MAENKKVTSTKKTTNKNTSTVKKKKTTVKKVNTNVKPKKNVKTDKSVVVGRKTKDKKVVETVNAIEVSENNVKEKLSFKKKVSNFFDKIKNSIKTKKAKLNEKKKIKKSNKGKDKKEKKIKSSRKQVVKNKKVSFKEKLLAFFDRFKKKSKKKPVKKNTKKKDKKKIEFFLTDKTKKIFIGLSILCGLIILLEIVYIVIHKINIDKKTVYYDAMNSLVVDGTDVVAVGSSNFRYSSEYSYTNGLEKAKLIKYDKNGKILFEKMFETGISTTFSSVISTDDGYIVVGSGIFSEKEQLEEAREAFIIKYDKDGNMLWEKFYHDITNTRFNKVIEISDGYIVVGQSIYANMEMGNHTTGGGIIIKYDKDGNLVWKNNHGGMKSGNFNDVVEVNGDFYVVGKDAVDSGNLVMFDENGKYKWHKNYSYTDGIGFTGITYLKDTLYVVGSVKILPEDIKEEDSRSTTNTDALLVAYSLDGKKKFEKNYGGSSYERYNSIITYRDELYVVGHISSKDAGFKIETDGELMTGLVVRYDTKGNILKKDVFGGSNNDNLTDIFTDGVCLYVSGYSNSGDGNITTAKNNGKDYFGKVIKLDFKFRTLLVK